MKKYDYSFLTNKISNETMNLLIQIEKYKSNTTLYEIAHQETFASLQKIAIVQSVKSSNAIEGIVTTDKRIKAIVNQGVEPLNHDEQEIAGYRDVLNNIHNDYNQYQLSEQTLLSFHSILMSYTAYDDGGEYKQNDNIIVEVDGFGRRSIRFKPEKAQDTKDAIEQMVLAYLDARDNSRVADLLLIGAVIFDFLSIHPFRDGNGRMSRLISLLLLYKEGYTFGRYASFEEQINKYKEEYYDALKQSSINWYENESDYVPFINNFLLSILRTYRELNSRFDLLQTKKDNKKTRIKNTIIKSMVPLSRIEIHNLWPDIAMETIKKEIKDLLKEELIEKVGSTKSAKYKKKQR